MNTSPRKKRKLSSAQPLSFGQADDFIFVQNLIYFLEGLQCQIAVKRIIFDLIIESGQFHPKLTQNGAGDLTMFHCICARSEIVGWNRSKTLFSRLSFKCTPV
jgi:hypothetical protein